MNRSSHADALLLGRISRRRVVSATLATGALAGLVPVTTFGQTTPEASPAASPVSSARSESWFVLSAAQLGGGFTTQADVFEVYSGITRERLGGFRAPGTTDMCVTAHPARILLAMQSGLGVFDIETGKLTEVDLGGATVSSQFWLPDPRVFPATPSRWSFVHTLDSAQAWLIDLDNATGIDLANVLHTEGSTPGFGNIVFSPNGDLAAAAVDGAGASIFDPEHPEKARKLKDGKSGALAGLPSFSASGKLIAYSILGSSTATDGQIVIEEVRTERVVLTIGNVSATTSAMFVPESETDILISGDGEVARQDIETGREAWSATTKNHAYAFGFTSDLSRLLYGSSERIGGDPFWDAIDLETGELSALPGLEGLTYYNGSYPADSPYTLFGPPYVSSSVDTVDSLVGFDNDRQTTTMLLDDVSSWKLSYGYSTSADGRIALFVDYDAHLMNLETGDVQTFPDYTTGSSSHGSFVSPDGSLAAISGWDASRAGTQSVYLIDVADGGEPEKFKDGVIWLWAGQLKEMAATGRTSTMMPAPLSRNLKRFSPLAMMPGEPD